MLLPFASLLVQSGGGGGALPVQQDRRCLSRKHRHCVPNEKLVARSVDGVSNVTPNQT